MMLVVVVLMGHTDFLLLLYAVALVKLLAVTMRKVMWKWQIQIFPFTCS